MTRQNSNNEENINLDQFLKISDYEDTVRQLDIYYGMGRCGDSVANVVDIYHCALSETATVAVPEPDHRFVPGLFHRHGCRKR